MFEQSESTPGAVVPFNDERGTVFIVQEVLRRDDETGALVPSFDYTPALEYGIIEFLVPYSPGGQLLLSTRPLIAQLRERLRRFCDDDYILPTGDPIAIAAVALVAAEMNKGCVKMLRWDKFTRRYIPTTLNMDYNGGTPHAA